MSYNNYHNSNLSRKLRNESRQAKRKAKGRKMQLNNRKFLMKSNKKKCEKEMLSRFEVNIAFEVVIKLE